MSGSEITGSTGTRGSTGTSAKLARIGGERLAAVSGSGQGSPRGRVLLVEDDPDTARFIAHVLSSRAGFDVAHEPSPLTALPRAGAEAWDLVITDIAMPDMTGLELLEQLRAQAPGLPVMVITAYASEANRLRALRSRADEFLAKPLRPDTLAAAVTGLAERGRASAPGGRAGRRVILAVGAHPGDVAAGAGGTLLAHRAAGHEVAVLTLSRDAAGESREAARILGAALYLEDIAGSLAGESGAAASAIRAVIAAIRPAAVYTHSRHDADASHRGTRKAVLAAVPEPGSVCCFQSPSATVDFRPDRFIDIEEHLAGKLAAVRAFAPPAARESDLAEATARYWSRFAASRYAEAFEVARQPTAGLVSVPRQAATAAGVSGRSAS